MKDWLILTGAALTLALPAPAFALVIGGGGPDVIVDASVLDDGGKARSFDSFTSSGLLMPGQPKASGERIHLVPPGAKRFTLTQPKNSANPAVTLTPPGSGKRMLLPRSERIVLTPPPGVTPILTPPKRTAALPSKPAKLPSAAEIEAEVNASAPVVAPTPKPAPAPAVAPTPAKPRVQAPAAPTPVAPPPTPLIADAPPAPAEIAPAPQAAAPQPPPPAPAPEPVAPPAPVAAAPTPIAPAAPAMPEAPAIPAPPAMSAIPEPTQIPPVPQAPPARVATANPATPAAPAPGIKAETPVQTVALVFEPDDARLNETHRTLLKSIVAKLSVDGDTSVQLLAYAQAENRSKARRLSLSRALAVRSYLLSQDVRNTRIEVRALGDQIPGGKPDRVDVVLERH